MPIGCSNPTAEASAIRLADWRTVDSRVFQSDAVDNVSTSQHEGWCRGLAWLLACAGSVSLVPVLAPLPIVCPLLIASFHISAYSWAFVRGVQFSTDRQSGMRTANKVARGPPFSKKYNHLSFSTEPFNMVRSLMPDGR